MKDVMKKYIYTVMIMCSLVMGGCNMVEVDEESLPGDVFWYEGNAADVEAFTLSIYNYLRNATMVKSAFFLETGDLRCAPIVASDGNKNNSTYAPLWCLPDNDMSTLRSTCDKDNKGTSWNFGQIANWNLMYQVIATANILQTNVDVVPNLSEAQVKSYKAEAIFMRNLTYFFLVRVFGDVPYFTDAFAYQPLPRTPMVDVLKSCLAEMQALLDSDPDAVALPWTYNSYAKKCVRANRGAALALMMHINMWLVRFDSNNKQSYYENVKTLGYELIYQNGGAYELLDFNLLSSVFQGGSSEGLFEIAQSIGNNEVFDQNSIYANYVNFTCFTDRSYSRFHYTADFLSKIYPEYIESTDEGEYTRIENPDKRIKAWFDDYMYISENSSLAREKEFKKLLNIDTYGESKITANSGNQIVFRLPDAILLYAEALAALGENNAALNEVNKIRSRAGAVLLTSSGTLNDDIFWERTRELMGEGHYYYDLVRTGKIHDMEYCNKAVTRMNFNQGAWTWPVSHKALENNAYMSLNLYWE